MLVSMGRDVEVSVSFFKEGVVQEPRLNLNSPATRKIPTYLPYPGTQPSDLDLPPEHQKYNRTPSRVGQKSGFTVSFYASSSSYTAITASCHYLFFSAFINVINSLHRLCTESFQLGLISPSSHPILLALAPSSPLQIKPTQNQTKACQHPTPPHQKKPSKPPSPPT